MNKTTLVALTVTAACLATVTTASAGVTVAGTGEPQFTRSDNNTQWIEWSASSAWDSYELRITHLRDGVQVAQQTVPTSKQGNASINWAGVVPLPLEQGREYEVCVQGRGILGGIPGNDGPDSCAAGQAAGKRTATTIDRSKPEISVELAAGSLSATAGSDVPLTITYSDTQAQPFPANFLCFGTGPDRDVPCGDGHIYGYSAPCSVPAGGTLDASFSCKVDSDGLDADAGPLWACVTSADSSVPDNPTSADQIGAANTANLSAKTCDSVELISAACTRAKARFARAKARLARLREEGAPKPVLDRAKARVRTARAAVIGACA